LEKLYYFDGMTRIFLIVGVLLFAVWVINKIWKGGNFGEVFKRKPKNACPKCDGLGYWEGLRSKERCDLCRGTGIVEE